MNTLRYAERLKESPDEENIVDKYVLSKPILKNDENFLYEEEEEDEDSIINESNEKQSDENEYEFKEDPRLYQSQDFSLSTDSNMLKDLKQEQIIQQEQPIHLK